jgi:hypothetical protein
MVRIERVTNAVSGLVYPLLIEAAGRRPPEDVGGPWGYAEFLKAIADPKHENHAEIIESAGERPDPDQHRGARHGRCSPRQGMVTKALHQAQTRSLIAAFTAWIPFSR